MGVLTEDPLAALGLQTNLVAQAYANATQLASLTDQIIEQFHRVLNRNRAAHSRFFIQIHPIM